MPKHIHCPFVNTVKQRHDAPDEILDPTRVRADLIAPAARHLLHEFLKLTCVQCSRYIPAILPKAVATGKGVIASVVEPQFVDCLCLRFPVGQVNLNASAVACFDNAPIQPPKVVMLTYQ